MKAFPVIDLFCGVGGLTHGFYKEGFRVIAGIDSDISCKYAYELNNGSEFIQADISKLDSRVVADLYPVGEPKILVGCAPCQPFSSYTNKIQEKDRHQWSLLTSFGKIVREIRPDIVSMENVPSLGSKSIFRDFIQILNENLYHVTWSNLYCPDYGIPQRRSRLVLFASRYGKLDIIPPTHRPEDYKTVRSTIGHLPPIRSGETHPDDSLHRAGIMSSLNMKLIKASIPGGTWEDWEDDLRAGCHRKDSGRSYYNVYGRMEWDDIAPTITTQFTGFGNGRFGHPEQDRALSLREGALLQTFPPDYDFIDPAHPYYITRIAKYIGNAVPVELGEAIAKSIRIHLEMQSI